MDRRFLEFWGNLMLNAAQGQKLLDDITAWMNQGFIGFETMTSFFEKTYGLDQMAKESPDYFKTWKKAQEDFKKSFTDYLAFFGVVPIEEHRALVKKYEELREKAASQEETIKHLRMLLSQVKTDEVVNSFGKLIGEQVERFQRLMASFEKESRKNSSKK